MCGYPTQHTQTTTPNTTVNKKYIALPASLPSGLNKYCGLNTVVVLASQAEAIVNR